MQEFELPPLAGKDRIKIISHLSEGLTLPSFKRDGIIDTPDGMLWTPRSVFGLRGVVPRVTYLNDNFLAGISIYPDDVVINRRTIPVMRVNCEEMRMVKEYAPNCRLDDALGYILGGSEGLADEIEFEINAQPEYTNSSEQDIRVKVDTDYLHRNFFLGRVTLIVLEPTTPQIRKGHPYDERNFVVMGEIRQRVPVKELVYIPKALRHSREVASAAT